MDHLRTYRVHALCPAPSGQTDDRVWHAGLSPSIITGWEKEDFTYKLVSLHIDYQYKTTSFTIHLILE